MYLSSEANVATPLTTNITDLDAIFPDSKKRPSPDDITRIQCVGFIVTTKQKPYDQDVAVDKPHSIFTCAGHDNSQSVTRCQKRPSVNRSSVNVVDAQ